MATRGPLDLESGHAESTAIATNKALLLHQTTEESMDRAIHTLGVLNVLMEAVVDDVLLLILPFVLLSPVTTTENGCQAPWKPRAYNRFHRPLTFMLQNRIITNEHVIHVGYLRARIHQMQLVVSLNNKRLQTLSNQLYVCRLERKLMTVWYHEHHN